MGSDPSKSELICEALWALGRRHGWSRTVGTEELVRDINVNDEKDARDTLRDELPKFDSVIYHPGTDEFSLDVPHQDIKEYLKDHCAGYDDLRIDATFK